LYRNGAASSELLTWKGCIRVFIMRVGHVPTRLWRNLQECNLPRPNHDAHSQEDQSDPDRLEAGRRDAHG
ncbi:MAG: hypothetical protein WBZ25_04065, partial [Pseudolabrys sp.]